MRRKKLIGRGVHSILGMASIAFLVVVVAFVGGCGGEQASNSSAGDQGGAEQTTESAEEPVASIGDTVTVGDVQWIVTKGEWSDVLVSRWGDQEGTFVILNLDLLNNSNQDLRLATPFLAVVDSEEREFEPDINLQFFHVWGDENLFVGKVEPGTTKKGMVIFPVDPDSSGFKLRVGEAKFASNKTRYIDLGVLPRAY